MPAPAVAHLVAAATLVAGFLAWLPLDLDGDGLGTTSEWQAGTNPWQGDSDGDLLEDGWEAGAGLDPARADGDRDGTDDWAELRGRTDPAAADSDGDGLADGAEPAEDCDGDGRPAGGDGDDDADGRVDPLEPVAQRCLPDSDGDGVLDGSEGAAACTRRDDCDRDGLADAIEAPAGLDPLDGDTFDVGLPDAVSWAFAQRGQSAGRDADNDGIPDPWEGSDGAIAWGDLTPSAGRRDLLVEYVRVTGPDSGRFSLDVSPVYRAVADTFLAQAGIWVTWTETRVALPSEQVPPIVPSVGDDYYADVLAQSRHATNPFVTTVVLNPQHDQTLVAHAGIAPIRGMVAAVDYGQSVFMEFATPDGQSLTMTPFIEELVKAFEAEPTTESQSILVEADFDQAGVSADGRIHLHSTHGYTLSWRPSWFASSIRVDFDDGGRTNLTLQSVDLDTAGLASTVLHELGHTLGLCHTHLADCDTVSSADRTRQHLSSMSYESAAGTLRFLPSEWDVVLDYVTCPPLAPITLLAQGATAADILDAKYLVPDDVETATDDRTCSDFPEVLREFDANVPAPGNYTPRVSSGQATFGHSGVAATAGLGVVLLALAATLDVVLWLRWRRSSS